MLNWDQVDCQKMVKFGQNDLFLKVIIPRFLGSHTLLDWTEKHRLREMVLTTAVKVTDNAYYDTTLDSLIPVMDGQWPYHSYHRKAWREINVESTWKFSATNPNVQLQGCLTVHGGSS